jgi:hypothetical protein
MFLRLILHCSDKFAVKLYKGILPDILRIYIKSSFNQSSIKHISGYFRTVPFSADATSTDVLYASPAHTSEASSDRTFANHPSP